MAKSAAHELKILRVEYPNVAGGNNVLVIHAASVTGHGLIVLALIARAGLLIYESLAKHRPEKRPVFKCDVFPNVPAYAHMAHQHFFHREHGLGSGHILSWWW